jgi:exodeoxyribonuclease VII small subunit
MNKDISYQEAQQELEHIVQALQEEHTDIDELSKKVKRAAALIALCRQKLRETEEEIGGLFEGV